ncbi:hypothetical protein AB6A40_011678, partial [Gnathostoma spinigerum]
MGKDMKIKCLLCSEKRCSIRHIHEHLCYKKYVCQACSHSFYTEDDSMIHKWKSNH